MKPEVFIGIPTYDNSVCIRTVSGLMAALQTKQCSVAFMNSSLLAHGFNQLWAQGLQSGAKYFP